MIGEVREDEPALAENLRVEAISSANQRMMARAVSSAQFERTSPRASERSASESASCRAASASNPSR